jgi:hypothetical protein
MAQSINIKVHLINKIRLEQALKNAGVENSASINKLIIEGKITQKDFGFIEHKMSKTLKELDMSKASIRGNKIVDFPYCSALDSISISASVIEIRNCPLFPSPFHHCIALTSISVHPDNPFYSSEEGVLFNKIKTELISCPRRKRGSYIIPNSVITIKDGAFNYCRCLTSVHIPDSVTEIGFFAFNGCESYITVHPENPDYFSKEGKLEVKLKTASGRANKLNWNLSEGTLTISGNCKIPDYSENKNNKLSPWYPYRKCIMSLVIKSGIDINSNYTFSDCFALSSVTFETGVHSILERALQGFTNEDTWNIDNWFLEIMPRMLQKFKKETNGFPGSMTSEEWDTILERMIYCFSEIKGTFTLVDENSDKLKDEGLELFRKHFWKLWW